MACTGPASCQLRAAHSKEAARPLANNPVSASGAFPCTSWNNGLLIYKMAWRACGGEVPRSCSPSPRGGKREFEEFPIGGTLSNSWNFHSGPVPWGSVPLWFSAALQACKGTVSLHCAPSPGETRISRILHFGKYQGILGISPLGGCPRGFPFGSRFPRCSAVGPWPSDACCSDRKAPPRTANSKNVQKYVNLDILGINLPPGVRSLGGRLLANAFPVGFRPLQPEGKSIEICSGNPWHPCL